MFFLIWIIKNITISGCLIFPITKLCSESLLWSNKNISKSVSIENEAWAKGWPDYVNDKNITINIQTNVVKIFIPVLCPAEPTIIIEKIAKEI